MGVSFDLFGTLVTADRPDDPAAAVATELAKRDVTVPDDWADAYAEPHVDAPDGAEVPLPAHVSRALASCGVDYEHNAARRAVVAAFDPTVETKPGALEAVDAARERGRWRSVRTAASRSWSGGRSSDPTSSATISTRS